MTEYEINRKLNSAVENTVPDVLSSVLQQCENLEKGKVIRMTETKKRKNIFVKFAAVAAAFVILAAGVVGTLHYRANSFVESKISLDVNPSIEIDINKNEKVLAVKPLNADGKKIVGDMDFKGSNLEVTVNALIGSMLKEGYIDELSNSILVSVDNDNKEKGEELKVKLSEMINTILSGEKFSGAVLSQTVAHDNEIQKKAEEYGITEGKAQLISKIVETDSRYTFDSLAALSVNELNILASSGEKLEENVEHTGTASEKKYIGASKAKTAALKHAGVAEKDISNYRYELDFDDGVMVYEIEFYVGKTEYEYEINAVDGAVVSHSVDRDEDDAPVNNTAPEKEEPSKENNSSEGNTSAKKYISESKAKAAALAHAGVKATDITGYSIELDDGVYEIDFDSKGYEYSYDINALTGKVIGSEKEKDDDYVPESSAVADIISKSKAKSKALADAGVDAADIRDYSIELDDDENVYEIEFASGAYEYSYEINALTGKIIDREKEKDDDYVPESSAAADIISKSKAKSKALANAGVDAADIRDYSIELDDDENVYEIEFISGAYEYSYEIDALTGKIIDSEKEKDD